MTEKKLKDEKKIEQSERFRREAQRLIDAGELNLTDADAALDRVVRKTARQKRSA